MVCFLGLPIIIPVIAVESIHNRISHIVATFFGTSFFIGLLSFIKKAKTIELFIAGTT
jgi:hypothetical protein